MEIVFFTPYDKDILKMIFKFGGSNNGITIALSLPDYLIGFQFGYAVVEYLQNKKNLLGYILFNIKELKYECVSLDVTLLTYQNLDIASKLIDSILDHLNRFALTRILTDYIKDIYLVNLYRNKGFTINGLLKDENIFKMNYNRIPTELVPLQIEHLEYHEKLMNENNQKQNENIYFDIIKSTGLYKFPQTTKSVF